VDKFIKGEIVECISNRGLAGLTNGKRYTCLHYEHCTDMVMVKNDNNVKEKYGSTNFKKI